MKNYKVIRITDKTYELLQKVKIIPRESFDSAVQRIATEFLENRE